MALADLPLAVGPHTMWIGIFWAVLLMAAIIAELFYMARYM